VYYQARRVSERNLRLMRRIDGLRLEAISLQRSFYSVESNLCRRGQYNGRYSETTICSPLNGGGQVMAGWIMVTCSAGAQTGVSLFVPLYGHPVENIGPQTAES
jgi:hypothetical protein